MSRKLSALWKRLAKLEQRMAEEARRAELANCTCIHMPNITAALPDQPEKLEAEMNLPCPAHGIRRLGRILRIGFVKPDDTRVPSPSTFSIRTHLFRMNGQAAPCRQKATLILKHRHKLS
jgi:hypothetical protein